MNNVREIPILQAGDSELLEISRKQLLSLDLAEMKAVRAYFRKRGRNPTDCELETIAQTWSEHCVHKSFKAKITYEEKVGGAARKGTTVLLREIAAVTKKLKKKWCLSVFEDNAGVIDFAGGYGVAFKVETHNHPSALEPYGGAGTGIGGVIRDILGVGLGAKPILNTDVFCFGPLDMPGEEVPEGVLHPRRVFKGVVSGVRDYGNRMGIPTGNGAIIFDRGYLANCLVFCGTVGLIPKDRIAKKVGAGDAIVVVGGRTGRDGIHGATFSSIELDKDTPTSVVQIGNPIVEKKVLDVLLTVRDKGLYSAITDCGAGGLSSAVGEMSAGLGAQVWLEKAPLKYRDLAPWEIWISESQERMVLAVPQRSVPKLLEAFEAEDVEAAVIGRFEKTGELTLKYHKDVVGKLDLAFLHDGLPGRKLTARYQQRTPADNPIENVDYKDVTLQLLKHPNIASRETVVRQYDHEVQGQTVLKPLAGINGGGPSDAVVLKPLYDAWNGIVVSCGINPFYGEVDPYAMAGCCIEEALRNAVCAGGNPERTAILDNFCWGDVRDEEVLGRLVRCVRGCRDYALAYGTPFISGKDSLNNFFRHEAGSVSIPGTLLISAVSVIDDARKIASSDFKKPGNPVYLCGATYREFGGSHYYRIFNHSGGVAPRPRPEKTRGLMKKIYRAVRAGLVAACHDCSEGGLAVAAAEMIIGGNWGAEIHLERVIGGDDSIETRLFSESQGRFVVEVRQEAREKFEKLMRDEDCARIGRIIPEAALKVQRRDALLFSIPEKELADAWKGTLSW